MVGLENRVNLALMGLGLLIIKDLQFILFWLPKYQFESCLTNGLLLEKQVSVKSNFNPLPLAQIALSISGGYERLS